MPWHISGLPWLSLPHSYQIQITVVIRYPMFFYWLIEPHQKTIPTGDFALNYCVTITLVRLEASHFFFTFGQPFSMVHKSEIVGLLWPTRIKSMTLPAVFLPLSLHWDLASGPERQGGHRMLNYKTSGTHFISEGIGDTNVIGTVCLWTSMSVFGRVWASWWRK